MKKHMNYLKNLLSMANFKEICNFDVFVEREN
jgi:hypothetical protein